MVRWLRAMTAAVLMMAAPVTPWAANPATTEIEYVYPDQSVWTTRTDERGRPLNPLLGLARSLFAETGLPWHASPYPAARMFTQLRHGGPVFSMLVAAPVLRECCLISREPVAHTEIRLYWRAPTPGVQRLEGLAGKSVAIIRGYSYGELAAFLDDPGHAVIPVTVDGHRAAFQMLEYRRADYVLDYAGPAGEILAEYPVADMQSALMANVEVHMVLGRGTPDAATVMRRLETAAARLDKKALLRQGISPDPAR